MFIFPLPRSVRRQLVDDRHAFHCDNYFALGGIRTCLGVSSDPMLLWISLDSCPMNLLLVRSHQAEITIVKRLNQEHNNVTSRVDPKLCDQGRCENFALSAALPTRFETDDVILHSTTL